MLPGASKGSLSQVTRSSADVLINSVMALSQTSRSSADDLARAIAALHRQLPSLSADPLEVTELPEPSKEAHHKTQQPQVSRFPFGRAGAGWGSL